jgi:hypothetical protein
VHWYLIGVALFKPTKIHSSTPPIPSSIPGGVVVTWHVHRQQVPCTPTTVLWRVTLGQTNNGRATWVRFPAGEFTSPQTTSHLLPSLSVSSEMMFLFSLAPVSLIVATQMFWVSSDYNIVPEVFSLSPHHPFSSLPNNMMIVANSPFALSLRGSLLHPHETLTFALEPITWLTIPIPPPSKPPSVRCTWKKLARHSER